MLYNSDALSLDLDHGIFTVDGVKFEKGSHLSDYGESDLYSIRHAENEDMLVFKNHYQADGKPVNVYVKFNGMTGSIMKVFVGFEWAPDAPVEKDTDAIGLEREEYLYSLAFLTKLLGRKPDAQNSFSASWKEDWGFASVSLKWKSALPLGYEVCNGMCFGFDRFTWNADTRMKNLQSE